MGVLSPNQLGGSALFRAGLTIRLAMSLVAVVVLARPVWVLAAPATAPSDRSVLDPDKLLAGPDLTEEQDSRRRELESVLDAARAPLDEATARAAMANWLLAVPTARPATRWILGADRPEDRRKLAESAASAREHLAAAATLLKKDDPDAASADKARRKRLSGDVESLKALAAMFANADAKGDEGDRREAWSDAAIDLSEARESENARLASAAALWQAMAWEQAGRRERALTALPAALAKPSQPFDFMSRILRCRILGDHGQYAAALALTSQIRSQIADWYPSERAIRHHARQRLVGLLQQRIGRQWLGHLQTQPAEADLLDGMLGDIQEKLFPPGDTSPEIYVMEDTVPMLVKPPPVKPAPGAPDEETATRPDQAARPHEPASAAEVALGPGSVRCTIERSS